MSQEVDQLRAENRRLRDEVERLQNGDSRERILEVARVVAAEDGFAAEITEVARRAGLSASTLYRHFTNREELIRSLVEKVAGEVATAAQGIAAIDDSEEALREWMLLGYAMVERWGMLATWVSAGLTPEWARGNARPSDLYRFTGLLLKRWRDAGCGREDMEIRAAVRVWFALASPLRVRGCLADGLSPREIADETLAIFRAYYAKTGA